MVCYSHNNSSMGKKINICTLSVDPYNYATIAAITPEFPQGGTPQSPPSSLPVAWRGSWGSGGPGRARSRSPGSLCDASRECSLAWAENGAPPLAAERGTRSVGSCRTPCRAAAGTRGGWVGGRLSGCSGLTGPDCAICAPGTHSQSSASPCGCHCGSHHRMRVAVVSVTVVVAADSARN